MKLNLLPSSALSRKRGSFVTAFSLTLASFAALGVAFLVNQGNVSHTPLRAESTYSAAEPELSEETEAPSDLKINLTTSAITDRSHTFRVSASSSSQETLTTSNRQRDYSIYLVVTDTNWVDFETANTEGTMNMNAAIADQSLPYQEAVYDAYVFNLAGGRTTHDIVIPESVYYGRKDDALIQGETKTVYTFRLNIVGIDMEVCSTYADSGEKIGVDYTNVESVLIPNTIDNVSEGAFAGAAAAGVAINLEKTEAEVNAAIEAGTWSESWIDATSTVTYGATYDRTSYWTNPAISGEGTKAFGVNKDFTLGSHIVNADRPELYQPMWVKYSVIDSEGNPVEGLQNQWMMQPLTSTSPTEPVDKVGNNVGSSTLYFNLDFEVPSGCEVDPESIELHNIYNAQYETINGNRIAVPIVDEGAYYCIPGERFGAKRNISSFLTYEFGSVVKMADYTGITMNLKTTQYDIYPLLKETQYRNNKARLDSGAYEIRMLFDPMATSYYRVVYEYDGAEVETSVRITTPISATRIYDGMTFMFLIKDSDIGEGYSYENLKELYFESFTVKMDIFDVDNYNVITGTVESTRFSSIALIEPETKGATGTIDLITIMIIVYVVFVIASAALAVILYFYKKVKYKNDEFRRVNGKNYVKKALIYIFGAFLIVSSLMFIIFRWGLLNNTVVVYNPVDVFVIIFTVAALIAAGVFIKNAVVAIKQSRERKEKARLHLDEDVVDDGTN